MPSLSNMPMKAWDHCIAIVRPALVLAPVSYLDDVCDRLTVEGIQDAVAHHDTATIYDWMIQLIDRQGISNAAAIAFAVAHGSARWDSVEAALADRPLCPKLNCWWHFHGCGYRKDAGSCARTDLLPLCPLPRLPARKGALNQAAIALKLFIRDCCDGDIVAWIDSRLAAADPGRGVACRAAAMRAAVIEPLVNVPGTGWKVWSIILAELLLGGDVDRERWMTSGASFVAVDSLVHAYLHRTGILRRLGALHAYGPACYAPGGCADIITGLAARVDAREFNAKFPACFPRFLQFAIWWFCAADGWAICNSNKIDDRLPCTQVFCPAFSQCDKIALKPHA